MPPLTPEQTLTLATATATLLGVAFGRLPGLHLNRATIALVGAGVLVATGVLELREAWALIDGEILTLLFALMVVNAALTHVGFFRLLTRLAVSRARSALGLLSALCLTTGIISAFFLNDTVALMFTPLVLRVCHELGLKPVPYLVALAASANVGSVATLTGNPQNLVIGVKGEIGYLAFARGLAPVALVGLVVVVALVALSHPREFRRPLVPNSDALPDDLKAPREGSRWRIGIVVVGMLAAFALGASVAEAALLAATALLLVGGIPADRLLAELDWNLLLLFAGLFVTVGALGASGAITPLFAQVRPLLDAGLIPLVAAVALLSNVLSNVPTVLLIAPAVPQLSDPQTAWLAVAMASTLAGNLTLAGAVANLIVAERARREGIKVSFWAFFKLGAPITVLTLLFGVWWLAWTP
jgi:Na+/H+ antiporter NhaD/arsenite permease-like protein